MSLTDVNGNRLPRQKEMLLLQLRKAISDGKPEIAETCAQNGALRIRHVAMAEHSLFSLALMRRQALSLEWLLQRKISFLPKAGDPYEPAMAHEFFHLFYLANLPAETQEKFFRKFPLQMLNEEFFTRLNGAPARGIGGIEPQRRAQNIGRWAATLARFDPALAAETLKRAKKDKATYNAYWDAAILPENPVAQQRLLEVGQQFPPEGRYAFTLCARLMNSPQAADSRAVEMALACGEWALGNKLQGSEKNWPCRPGADAQERARANPARPLFFALGANAAALEKVHRENERYPHLSEALREPFSRKALIDQALQKARPFQLATELCAVDLGELTSEQCNLLAKHSNFAGLKSVLRKAPKWRADHDFISTVAYLWDEKTVGKALGLFAAHGTDLTRVAREEESLEEILKGRELGSVWQRVKSICQQKALESAIAPKPLLGKGPARRRM